MRPAEQVKATNIYVHTLFVSALLSRRVTIEKVLACRAACKLSPCSITVPSSALATSWFSTCIAFGKFARTTGAIDGSAKCNALLLVVQAC